MILIVAALNLAVCPSAAFAGNDKDWQKVRAQIGKLGVGRDSRLEVRLRDKSRVNGYISRLDRDSFVLSDLESDRSTTVSYPDVAQAKGQNLTKGARIAIGVGIVAAVAIVAFIKWAGQFQ
jgi:hypothetical protein